jgi:protein-arginine kinase activator protein McsA
MICECCHKNKSRIRICDLDGNSVVKEFNVCPDCFNLIKRMMYDGTKPLLTTADIIHQVQSLLHTEQTALALAPEPGAIAPVLSQPAAAVTCSKCGMTLAEFKARGRFGCANDYEAFADHLDGLLERIHDTAEARHKGRLPGQSEAAARRRRIAELRSRLQGAVTEENYELAARLRDQIQELEQDLSEGAKQPEESEA